MLQILFSSLSVLRAHKSLQSRSMRHAALITFTRACRQHVLALEILDDSYAQDVLQAVAMAIIAMFRFNWKP